MNDLKIYLEGLTCANCASKIEDKIKKLNKVNSSSVNFINKYIIISHNSNNDEIFTSVKKIIQKIEPNVLVTLQSKKTNITSCLNNKGHFNKNINMYNVRNYNLKRINLQKQLPQPAHTISHSHTTMDNKKISHNLSSKIKLARIILSSILFILGFIFSSFSNITSIVFFILSYSIIGYDVLFDSVKNIINLQFLDENFLMSIASIGAVATSQYPEAAGVMLFFQIGELLQDLAVNKSRKQIKSLLNIKPEFANLKTESGYIKVHPDKIKIGDIIIVKPGEKIPLDGIIIEGSSSIDTSSLTGESMPVDVGIGQNVLNGTINLSGLLTIKTTKIFNESTVAKILYLVEKASDKKSETENFITKFAKYYTPSVVFIAILITIIPTLFFHQPFNNWLYKGLTFLVVSCPCALVLSIPLSYFSGLGTASKNGILIKGGNYLEALYSSNLVIFDKTGTLTEGSFNVSEIKTYNSFSESEMLKLVALCEHYSNHPIANSIKKEYFKTKEFNNNLSVDFERTVASSVKNYSEIPGQGISAEFNGKKAYIGNEKLIKNVISNFTPTNSKPGTILYVALDNTYIGYILISDTIKEDAKEAVALLKSLGISETIMLTGDNETTASFVKNTIGIDKAYSKLLPANKLEILEKIKANNLPNKKIIYVGDGINDAPVLIGSDIGIAMGGVGSDAAIEAADIVIVNDELSKIGVCIKIAKKTKKIVWQNIIFCLGIKLVIMLFAIFSNVPMPLAVFADVGVALIAIINSQRLLFFK